MGNVLAGNGPSPFSSSPASQSLLVLPPPPINPLLSPSLTPPDDLNPGYFEDLHKKCKELFPMTFEGLKIQINKNLSSHFLVSHTLNMGTTSGYKFGVTYVGSKQVSPTECYPVFLGEIDPDFNLNASILHLITPNIRTKFAAQIHTSKWVGSEWVAAYRGSNYTADLTCLNLSILQGSGLLALRYLQTVSSQLCLGAEMAYQFGPYIPPIALVSAAGRFDGSNFTLSGTLNSQGTQVCYYHKGYENLQIGVEVQTKWMTESVCSIGYQVDLPNVIFKGMVTSNWVVAAVLEKKLHPLPFTFTLCASLNHHNNQCKVGFSLSIG